MAVGSLRNNLSTPLRGVASSMCILLHCLWGFGGGSAYRQWAGDIALLKCKLLLAESNDKTKALDRVFQFLTILDGKATGLLSVNTLLAAFLTIFIGFYKDPAHSDNLGAFGLALALMQLFLVIVSALFCMAIVRMKWGFWRSVLIKDDKLFADAEFDAVTAVACERTYLFQVAWLLTVTCLVLLLPLAIIYVKS